MTGKERKDRKLRNVRCFVILDIKGASGISNGLCACCVDCKAISTIPFHLLIRNMTGHLHVLGLKMVQDVGGARMCHFPLWLGCRQFAPLRSLAPAGGRDSPRRREVQLQGGCLLFCS